MSFVPTARRSPSSVDPSMALLSELVRHLRAIEDVVAGLRVGESGSVVGDDQPTDVERGVLVRYRPDPPRGEVRLWVSPRRVKLNARWEGERGSMSVLEDRFVIRLGERPTWGGRRFDSPGACASALVALMRRRLRDLAISSDGGGGLSEELERKRS